MMFIVAIPSIHHDDNEANNGTTYQSRLVGGKDLFPRTPPPAPCDDYYNAATSSLQSTLSTVNDMPYVNHYGGVCSTSAWYRWYND
jgi:hypothetical protein